MKTRGIIYLVVASVFWGLAFSIQSIAGKDVGAHTFNALRMLLGSLFMIPAIKFFDAKGYSANRPASNTEWKRLWKFGIICGIFLGIATNLQQLSLNLGAEAGRAGFLTALYILMVPIVGIFLKKRFGWNMWVGVVIALAGMYFLCITGEFRISVPDLLLILCALAFTFQICTIDLATAADALRLSAIEFFICGIFSLILTIIFEIIPNEGGIAGWGVFFGSGSFWLLLLYMAIFSGCFGYTLQILGQRHLAPPVASLIMSLESVFSVIFGFLILHEAMTGRQLLGCGLIFAAIIITQIPFPQKQHPDLNQTEIH